MKEFTYTDRPPERALIAVVHLPGHEPLEESRAEMARLVEAANGVPLDSLFQTRRAPDPRTFIGKGKLSEIHDRARDLRADLVVFDCDLSPSQKRHIEDGLQVRVVDRTELILDIFARRARTRAARVQVELAQLEYLLPRLTRRWSHLERTEGAIGSRGPGETQLETDRRLVRKRIERLKGELTAIEARREREATAHEGFFRVSLVGYTNAGKSSLLNALTGDRAPVADRLFHTLDTRTRLWTLRDRRKVLLSDTVGFVRRLPHDLVASFHATLAESIHADLLLLAVDASRPDANDCLAAVERTLAEVGAMAPVIYVLNQVDRVTDTMDLTVLERPGRTCVRVSAKTKVGFGDLDRAVCGVLDGGTLVGEVWAKTSDGRTLAELRKSGVVLEERYDADLWRARMRFRRALVGRLLQMRAHGAIGAHFDAAAI